MERIVVINGAKVNIIEKGSGAPVLILHGWGSNASSWKGVIDKLSKENFRAFAVDFPGFGKSPEPSPEWGLSNYTSLIHQLIKELDIENCVLVGHSFGCRVGINLVAEHPSDVNLLVLCGAAGIDRHYNMKTSIIFHLSRIGNFLFSIKGLRFLKKYAQKGLYFLARRRDYYRASNTMKKVMAKVIEVELKDLLPKIQQPTLLLWGDQDNVTPVSDAHFAHSIIPKSEIVVLDGYGHSLQIQAPSEVSDRIVHFSKKHYT